MSLRGAPCSIKPSVLAKLAKLPHATEFVTVSTMYLIM